MLTRNIVDSLASVVWQEPSYDLLRRIQLFPDQEVLADCVVNELRQHRVVLIAKYNIERLENVDPFYYLLSSKLKQVDVAWMAPEYTSKQLQTILPVEDALFIKGSAISTLYPPFLIRDRADRDILVPNFDALWPLLDAATERYRVERLKLYIHVQHEVSGSIDLHPLNRFDNLPGVDVHVNAFPIWGATKFEANLWERKIRVDGVFLPSWEDTLLLLAAHIATQWLYRVRDLNDIYVILSKLGSSLDWDYILKTAQKENLTNILSLVLHGTQRLYNLPSDTAPLLRRKLTFAEELFVQRSYGSPTLAAGLLLQSKFLYRRYNEDFGLAGGLYHLMQNGCNMIRYNYRAFSAHHRREIRKIKPNEVLVLVPIFPQSYGRINGYAGQPLGTSSLQVVNQGTPKEYFITPYGVWAQASYSGVLSDFVRDQIVREVNDDLDMLPKMRSPQ
jgi:hypothetical protein